MISQVAVWGASETVFRRSTSIPMALGLAPIPDSGAFAVLLLGKKIRE
jgi:hypothetical protein